MPSAPMENLARSQFTRPKPPPQNIVRIKIISMGDVGTGKSCLIKRYCEEKFVSKYISTIGVDFGVKQVNVRGIDVKVNFWDLAGSQEFYEVRNEFYRDSQGAILVYDVTSKKSFECLDAWVREAQKFGAGHILIVVCGNKTDQKKRVVAEKEGRAWATQNGYMYFETSANTGENVSQMFNTLFAGVLDMHPPQM